MLTRLALVISLAGLMFSLTACVYLYAAYVYPVPVYVLLLDALIVTKGGAILLVLMTIGTRVLAAIHRGQERTSERLARNQSTLAMVSIVVGAVCAFHAYWWGVRYALWSVNEVTFAMEAPAWAEAIFILALGFLTGVIALLGAAPKRLERHRL